MAKRAHDTIGAIGRVDEKGLHAFFLADHPRHARAVVLHSIVLADKTDLATGEHGSEVLIGGHIAIDRKTHVSAIDPHPSCILRLVIDQVHETHERVPRQVRAGHERISRARSVGGSAVDIHHR